MLLDSNVKMVPNPEGETFKVFPISSMVTEADAIINLPRLKTHMQTKFTGAVKNIYGCIPGLRKMEYHLTAQKAGIDFFSDMLIDLNLLVKPRLSIMDAVIAMEGPGPATGEQRNLGWLAASDDTFSMDMLTCSLVGFETDYVPTLRRAVQRGLGPESPEYIKVLGEEPGKLAVSDFVRSPPPPPPRKKGRSRLWYMRMRARQKFLGRTYSVKPYAGRDCDGCGDCVEACPVDVAVLDNGGVSLGGDGCIRCFSCIYDCPRDAVYAKPSFIARGMS